uniref:Uncharacterized protein n=1 Tax=Anguilla anguilla TaxID=7936 RepID=A0A0E9RC37_ANGAN
MHKVYLRGGILYLILYLSGTRLK